MSMKKFIKKNKAPKKTKSSKPGKYRKLSHILPSGTPLPKTKEEWHDSLFLQAERCVDIAREINRIAGRDASEEDIEEDAYSLMESCDGDTIVETHKFLEEQGLLDYEQLLDLVKGLDLDVSDIKGVEEEVTYGTCKRCGGKGKYRGFTHHTDEDPCTKCNGTGKIRVSDT